MADVSPKIFPERSAQHFAKYAGKKYRPANGHEGELFFGAWCAGCERDRAFRESDCECPGCDILARTYAFDVDDLRYPSEWIIGTDGQPRCTAFVAAGTAVPQARCDNTQDMFGEPSDAS